MLLFLSHCFRLIRCFAHLCTIQKTLIVSDSRWRGPERSSKYSIWPVSRYRADPM